MVSFGRRIKKRIKTVLHEEDAVATVFFLLTGSAMLVLFLAVLNYGRYLMAVRQAELALEASAASILSYYEPQLTREFGLFALDTRNENLPAKGKAYFIDNLGAAGTINGQTCLDYILEYPEGSRMSTGVVLQTQAVDLQRIEGWAGMGKDLLFVLGKTEWNSLLGMPDKGLNYNAAPDTYATADESGGFNEESAEEPAGEAEIPEWQRKMENNIETGGSGRIRFWHLLSPFPPTDVFTDRRMPAAITTAFYQEETQLNDQTDFWENTFLNPAEAVRDPSFLSGMMKQIGDFLSVVKLSLTTSAEKGMDKLLFTEYLLQELDFATNKPLVNRYFTRCEVEYMICGFDSTWDNMRNMALRLFLLRTSLHVLDSLISIEVMSEEAFILALVNGILNGSADVEKLIAGGRIPAYPGNHEITMSYKDHLRLFLLCQSENEQQQALQRLTQANLWHWAGGSSAKGGSTENGKDAGEFLLSRYATEVRVMAETEVSLWPFGSLRIRKEGVMGYDRPFTLSSKG